MTRSLRRSRRSTKKGISEYNEGDIVEVSGRNVLNEVSHNIDPSCRSASIRRVPSLVVSSFDMPWCRIRTRGVSY
jgi:hypothetical protein